MLRRWTDLLLGSACFITLYCTLVYLAVLLVSGAAPVLPFISAWLCFCDKTAIIWLGCILILLMIFFAGVFCILLLGWGRCLRLAECPDCRLQSLYFIPLEPLFLLPTLWRVSWRRGRLAFTLFLIGAALLFSAFAGSAFLFNGLVSGDFYRFSGQIDSILCSEELTYSSYPIGLAVCYCLFFWFLSFLLLVPMLAERKGLRGYYPVWTLIVALPAAIFSAYGMIWYLDAEVEQRTQELRNMRIPVCAADLKEPYFHGMKPDPAWVALVNRKDAPEKELLSHPLLKKKKTIWSAADCKVFGEELKRHEDFLRECDAVFSRAPVKYAIDCDGKTGAGLLLPHLGYCRDIARLYRARIRVALQKHDLLEVLRLYELFGRLLDSAADENFLIGGLVYYACLNIRDEAIMDMMSSGLLTEKELMRIEEDAAKRETALPETGKRALLSDAALIDTGDCIIKSGKGLCRPFIPNPFFPFWYCKFREEQLFMMDFWRNVANEMNSPDWDPLSPDTVIARADRDGYAFHGLRFLPAMLFPALNVFWKRAMSAVARLRQVRIACGIERFRGKYGRLPETLDELGMKEMPLDPFSKKPFTYTAGKIEIGFRSPEGSIRGYRLYGVGCNDKTYPPGADSGDIFIVSEPGSYIPAEERGHPGGSPDDMK